MLDAVYEQASAQSPAGRWLGEEKPEQYTQGSLTGSAAASDAGGERPGQSAQERGVEVIRSAVGDTGGEPALFAGGAWREVRAEARSDQRDPPRVDIGAGQGVIDDRADDVFPVGSEREVLLNERAALAGAVEREDVVAAGECSGAVGQVQLFDGAVVPPVRMTVARGSASSADRKK